MRFRTESRRKNGGLVRATRMKVSKLQGRSPSISGILLPITSVRYSKGSILGQTISLDGRLGRGDPAPVLYAPGDAQNIGN
jgi:hypothetical protein